MNLRAADLRFVLPHAPRTAAMLAGAGDNVLDEMRAALEAVGVDTSDRVFTGGRPAPDVIIATADIAAHALAIAAPAHLLLGRVVRPVGRSSLPDRATRPLLIRGPLTRPTNMLPIDTATPLLNYLRIGARSPSFRERARNRLLASVVRTTLPASLTARMCNAWLSVPADQARTPPRLVAAAAAECGFGSAKAWRLSLGRGDDLQRAIFYVFDGARPEWVLKFSRVRGYNRPFAREEEALRLLSSFGGVIPAHTPVHLARLSVDGLPASVESAAAGRPLVEQLGSKSIGLVHEIAEWILLLGDRSARPPAALQAERARLIADVVPRWVTAGAPGDLVTRVRPVIGVLQHNDLGSWNILSDGTGFTVVDWESTRDVGFPLWDLLYFLGDALPRLDGPAGADELLERAVALFAGRSPRSSLLFGWLRRAAARLHVPQDSVGPIATLCWLHHGLSEEVRRGALNGASAAPAGHLARLSRRWLDDEALGAQWPAWRVG